MGMTPPTVVEQAQPEAIDKLWDSFVEHMITPGAHRQDALRMAQTKTDNYDALTLTCFVAFCDGYYAAK